MLKNPRVMHCLHYNKIVSLSGLSRKKRVVIWWVYGYRLLKLLGIEDDGVADQLLNEELQNYGTEKQIKQIL